MFWWRGNVMDNSANTPIIAIIWAFIRPDNLGTIIDYRHVYNHSLLLLVYV
jgi:hypothetical protein